MRLAFNHIDQPHDLQSLNHIYFTSLQTFIYFQSSRIGREDRAGFGQTTNLQKRKMNDSISGITAGHFGEGDKIDVFPFYIQQICQRLAAIKCHVTDSVWLLFTSLPLHSLSLSLPSIFLSPSVTLSPPIVSLFFSSLSLPQSLYLSVHEYYLVCWSLAPPAQASQTSE